LKPPFYPKDAPLLTLMAAVATASAIKEYIGLDVTLKWPNDILADDKKAGGILTEMRTEGERIIFAAIGIGLNVNMSLEMFPEDIRTFTTSLMEEKAEHIDRVKLLECILGKIEYWYKVLLNGDKKALINQWLLLNSTT
ncbi:MAG: biotin--[acetyl-CoA-carboxylase] ligase, partial [Nitrospirae bacterium]|nr:biotin--[acetyl-CoA-carboxylase] ligase [Nitrospirota bacterium]